VLRLLSRLGWARTELNDVRLCLFFGGYRKLGLVRLDNFLPRHDRSMRELSLYQPWGCGAARPKRAMLPRDCAGFRHLFVGIPVTYRTRAHLSPHAAAGGDGKRRGNEPKQGVHGPFTYLIASHTQLRSHAMTNDLLHSIAEEVLGQTRITACGMDAADERTRTYSRRCRSCLGQHWGLQRSGNLIFSRIWNVTNFAYGTCARKMQPDILRGIFVRLHGAAERA
jgi:hypothetical protein